MKPGDRARWLQCLVMLILVTAYPCSALSSAEKRWEKADLIVEGRITETTTENGVQISKLSVDRILKTETLASMPYSKGLVEGITLQIPLSSLTKHQTHIFFLKENQGTYRLIGAEKVENPAQAPVMSTSTIGFLLLILIALIASNRPLIIPENRGK